MDELEDKRAIKINTEREVSGIVVSKYKKNIFLDSRDKIPVLRVDNSTGFIEFKILGWCRGTTFWEYVAIGDSISKPSGALNLTIVKPSGETKTFRYYSLADNKKKKRNVFIQY